ncbi:MAG: aggregation factor core [Pseudomonadota bacterium]
MRLATLCLAISCAAPAVSADQLEVRFMEGAPKDRFIFANASACPLEAAVITLDLAGSAGGLIFDVTGTGAGVSVYQPFEVVAGAESLQALPDVLDGDVGLSLAVAGLAPGHEIAFTIDVDDTINRTATMVADSEIRGASVVLDTQGGRYIGTFNGTSSATLALPPCPNA